MKVTLLRLPDAIGTEIQKMADKKGIPFATAAKELICEQINEIVSASACKQGTDTSQHTN